MQERGQDEQLVVVVRPRAAHLLLQMSRLLQVTIQKFRDVLFHHLRKKKRKLVQSGHSQRLEQSRKMVQERLQKQKKTTYESGITISTISPEHRQRFKAVIKRNEDEQVGSITDYGSNV